MTGNLRRLLLRLPAYAAAVLVVDRILMPGLGSAAEPATIEVRLQDHSFVPDVIRANPGDTIRFLNVDEDLHSVLLIEHEDVVQETFIDPGKAIAVHLPGDMPRRRFELACTIHVGMRATLVVS